MTIVHGVLSLDVGGLERIVIALARGQAAAGHAVTIVCVDKPGMLAADAGVPVVSLDKPPGRPAAFLGHVADVMNRLKPEVLHTHQIGAAYHLALHTKARVIHTEHGDAFARAGGIVECLRLRWIYHRTAKRIDRFACVSDDIAASVAKWRTVPWSKITVVPNGIATPVVTNANIRADLGIPADAFVIGTVGRLHEVKQQHVLLRAVAEVMNAWALLVGDGPEMASLKRLAAKLKMEHRTLFAGYQAEPANFLHAMDVFALTSRSEGLPVSLLEAWALEKPVVCSAVGGLKAVIRDGVNGVLVNAGDVAGFAAAFARLNGAGERRGIAAEGRRTFETKYAFETMLQRYADLYQ